MTKTDQRKALIESFLAKGLLTAKIVDVFSWDRSFSRKEEKYTRECPNCHTKTDYCWGDFLIKRMSENYCGKCWRDRPDKQPKFKLLPRSTKIPLDYVTDLTKGIADVYCRVSSLKQSYGDGLRRQEEYAINYCKENQIKIRTIIQDIGSAYNKDNCITGNLGLKIKDWENGQEKALIFWYLKIGTDLVVSRLP